MALIKLGVTKRMLWSHTHTSEPRRDEHTAMNASRGSDVTRTHVERRGDQHLLWHSFFSEKREECEGGGMGMADRATLQETRSETRSGEDEETHAVIGEV